jgi:cell division septation protein DedD
MHSATAGRPDAWRRRMASFLLFGLLLCLLAPASPAAAGPEDPTTDEARFVALINEARARNGVGPLTVDGELTVLARDWAAQMAAAGGISHAKPISAGVTQDWQKLGENVGRGPSVDPIMDAFIASPGHYANLMDPAFTRIGVGVVWSDGVLYTTHRFMQLRGESAPVPPATTAAPAPVPPTTERPAPAPTTPPAPITTAPPAPEPDPAPPTTPPPAVVPGRVAVVLLALRAAQE